MSTISIIIHLSLTTMAFSAVYKRNNTLSIALGLGFLIARGGMLLTAGILTEQGLIVILLGTISLSLAAYGWWHGRQ